MCDKEKTPQSGGRSHGRRGGVHQRGRSIGGKGRRDVILNRYMRVGRPNGSFTDLDEFFVLDPVTELHIGECKVVFSNRILER